MIACVHKRVRQQSTFLQWDVISPASGSRRLVAVTCHQGKDRRVR
jgi:hypothetical protein